MDTANDNVENPLQLYNFSETKHCKTSGRPRKKDNIIFSTPPRSIVSLLLSKKPVPVVQTDTCNINMTKLCEKKHEKQWLCRQCAYRTYNQETYKEHMISHKNQLRYCDYSNCTYSTKSSSNLIKHKRTHTSEKPYICDKCLFRTNFQNSLTVHKRIHTLERPYACHFCEYKCNSSSNLKKHCAYRHPKKE